MSDKNYINVEIPKVIKAVDMMLSFCQTRHYGQFKKSVYRLIEAPEYKEQLKPWLDDGGYKKIDLAIALGVWEVEK